MESGKKFMSNEETLRSLASAYENGASMDFLIGMLDNREEKVRCDDLVMGELSVAIENTEPFSVIMGLLERVKFVNCKDREGELSKILFKLWGKDLWNRIPYKYSREEYQTVIRKFVEVGINVNVKNYYGSTHLHEAVDHKLPSIVELLISVGANTNANERKYQNGETPLMRAVIYEELTSVELLIDITAIIYNRSGSSGATILRMSNKFCKSSVVDKCKCRCNFGCNICKIHEIIVKNIKFRQCQVFLRLVRLLSGLEVVSLSCLYEKLISQDELDARFPRLGFGDQYRLVSFGKKNSLAVSWEEFRGGEFERRLGDSTADDK